MLKKQFSLLENMNYKTIKIIFMIDKPFIAQKSRNAFVVDEYQFKSSIYLLIDCLRIVFTRNYTKINKEKLNYFFAIYYQLYWLYLFTRLPAYSCYCSQLSFPKSMLKKLFFTTH